MILYGRDYIYHKIEERNGMDPGQMQLPTKLIFRDI